MAATDVQLMLYMVELRSGLALASARKDHMSNLAGWCKKNTHSKIRRTMLHDSLDYYAYTGLFTADVMKKIKADTAAVSDAPVPMPTY